jgi:HTH-type transcriptional regulator/antitoxin HipB
VDYSIKTLSQLRPILQGFRKAAGLTQVAMASHLGVTQQTYAQLEANPATVSVERLFKVLRVLQVDLKLTQSAATSSESSGTESNTSSAPVVAQPANKAAAATAKPRRKTQPPRKQETAAKTPARTRPSTKQPARTTTRKTSSNAASKAPRGVAKPERAAKKRENW